MLKRTEMTTVRKNLIPVSVFLVSLAAVLSGCSTANQDSSLNLVDSSGKHPQGWLKGHRFYALSDGSICAPCHGDNLDGGIVELSCSTASLNGQDCHANGPALHTLNWLDKFSPNFHALAYSPSSNTCGICHDIFQPDTYPGYNCLDCHFSEDGTQRTPEDSDFSHTGYGDDHMSFPLNESQVCVNCHATNLAFGNQAWCHNCHE